jgi:hypothetical protein
MSDPAIAPLASGVRKPKPLLVLSSTLQGGSVNRRFKTPVIIANTGPLYRKRAISETGLRENRGSVPTYFHEPWPWRYNRPASPPDFPASRFSRSFSDLETPIYRAPLYPVLVQYCFVELGYYIHLASTRPWPEDHQRGELLPFSIVLSKLWKHHTIIRCVCCKERRGERMGGGG